MAIRKILVPINGGTPARVALTTALLLARRLDAHIKALHVGIDPVDSIPLIGEGVSAAMLEELFDINKREAQARAADARQVFDSVVSEAGLSVVSEPAAHGVSLAFSQTIGHPDDIIASEGRLADLLVLPRPRSDTEASEASLEAALFETGRPVLIAPQQTPSTIGDHVVIAWNASVEAARAVAFALPILRLAKQTTVMTVADAQTEEELPKQLADYLAWHGIVATPRMILGAGSAEDALTQAARDTDLLVMGAYTTSRLRELILGGVTRHMLDTATMPLLLAH